MPDRRQFITGIAAVSTVGIAGCVDTDEPPEPEGDDGIWVLPPDSSQLFAGGELNEHKFA